MNFRNKSRTYLYAGLGAMVLGTIALPLSGQSDSENSAPVDNTAAFQAMGYAMGQQLRLNVGFSNDELAQIFYGMRLAASDEDQPENFEAAVREAQTIYMGRMQAWQAKEQERLAKVAEENQAEAEEFFATLKGQSGIEVTESGLHYKLESKGNEVSPSDGDKVVINYRGTLLDGQEFDANEGAEFSVNQVVPGFKEALMLLSEGGSGTFYLPSELGYGDRPQRPGSVIEPGDALIFEVELLQVQPKPEPPKNTPTLPPGMGKPPAGGPPNYTPPPPPNYTPPPPPSSGK